LESSLSASELAHVDAGGRTAMHRLAGSLYFLKAGELSSLVPWPNASRTIYESSIKHTVLRAGDESECRHGTTAHDARVDHDESTADRRHERMGALQTLCHEDQPEDVFGDLVDPERSLSTVRHVGTLPKTRTAPAAAWAAPGLLAM
jgi:hypothetical protein